MNDWKNWPIMKKGRVFYRGNWDEELFRNAIVVVGSRKMTRYGKETIGKLMPDLVANRFTIISGFMYGVDTEAHSQCIEMGGKTVAVLGSGLNYLTTADNDQLYTNILTSGGVVMSEYEPDFKATIWSFPQRNKVVASLATEGIVVIEAGLKSGSLITARLGREMNKTVYAIPGPINSKASEGCNWLIKTGRAKMATEIGDILEGVKSQVKLFETDLDNNENTIFKLLENEAMTVDEIAKRLQKTVSEISITVSLLSMKNVVSEEMGKVYLNRL